jgi:hypothetical protein
MSDDNNQTENPTATDVDGNTREKVSMDHHELVQFGELLIQALFAGSIKDDAPDEAKENILGEVKALCLIRGILTMCDDLQQSGKGMAKVLEAYSRKATGHIQGTANQLYTAEKDDDKEVDAHEAPLLAFFKAKGIQHMPEPDDGGLAEGLEQMIRSLGLPEELVAEFAGALQGKKAPTPGCDCPGCTRKRELLEQAKGSVVAGEEEEDGEIDMANHPDGLFAGLPGARALREAREQQEAEEREDEAPPPTAAQ